MQIDLPSRTSPTEAIRRASAKPARRLDVELGLEEEGQRFTGASTPRRRRESCARCERARPNSESAARAAPSSPFSFSPAAPASPPPLLEALRVEPVEVDAVDRDPDLVAQVLLQRHRLVDRHLLRQRDDRGAGVLVVGDEAVERLGLGVDRADAGDRGEGARRLQEADPVAGGRRVDDHQVVLAADFTLRSSWASSQILPIVTSSFSPGVAAAR